MLARDVTPGARVRALGEAFHEVTAVTPTGTLKFGTADVPMLRLVLAPTARPAKSIELAADQEIEVR